MEQQQGGSAAVPERHPVRNGVLAAVGLIAVILIWGYFYSLTKVSFSDKDLPVFPEDDYKTAGQVIDQPANLEYIGPEQVRNTILSVLGDIPADYPVNKVFETLAALYKDKSVLVGAITKSIKDSSIEAKYKEMRSAYNKDIRTLSRRRSAGWKDKIALLKKKRTANYKLSQFSEKFSVRPQLLIPHNNQYVEFSYVAGPFGRFEQLKGDQFIYKADKGRAVVTRDFLKNAGVPADAAAKADLVADNEKLETIKKNDWAEVKERRLKLTEQAKGEVVHGRTSVRARFYRRWFGTVLLFVFTYLMTKLLARYMGTVQRHAGSSLESEEELFVISVTGRILRGLALTILVIGIVCLWLDAIKVLFTGRFLMAGRFLGRISLKSGVIKPLASALVLIAGTWMLLIEADLARFVSSVFRYIHKKDEEKESLPAPAAAPAPAPAKKKAAAKKKKDE